MGTELRLDRGQIEVVDGDMADVRSYRVHRVEEL